MICILYLSILVLVAAVDENVSQEKIDEHLSSTEEFNDDMLKISNETMEGRGLFPMNHVFGNPNPCSVSAIRAKYQIDELAAKVQQCQAIVTNRISNLTSCDTVLQGLHTQKTTIRSNLNACNIALATLRDNLAKARCDVEKCLAIQECLTARNTDLIEMGAIVTANNALITGEVSRCFDNLNACSSNFNTCGIACP